MIVLTAIGFLAVFPILLGAVLIARRRPRGVDEANMAWILGPAPPPVPPLSDPEEIWKHVEARATIARNRKLHDIQVRAQMRTAARAPTVMAVPPKIPVPSTDYRGRYMPGTISRPGDIVRFQGGVWLCERITRSQPGSSPAWRHMLTSSVS